MLKSGARGTAAKDVAVAFDVDDAADDDEARVRIASVSGVDWSDASRTSAASL